MSDPNLYETLQAKFGDQIAGANLEALDEWIEVTAAGLVDVCHFLKHDPDWQFNLLNCITVVDYFEPDPKKAAKEGIIGLQYHSPGGFEVRFRNIRIKPLK